MRLKKLTIQAFGPFKDKVEIDFESRNINSGLLLISGDTGAGKTSIFDAICFALYGEASGESRKTNSLRSDFASNDVETFVKLEFYHNNKLYEIKRSPEYYRQSKRGDGLTKQAPVAEFEINGRIETKTSVVTKEIENLLGLDYKQFHQVCMLSQGEFTKFLLASSDEKTSIFRKIFNTDIYSLIMNKLKDDLYLKSQSFDIIKGNIQKEREKLDSNYDYLTDEELINKLNETINENTKELTIIKNQRDELNNEIKKKHTEVKEQENINNKIDELTKSQEELKKLELNNKDIDDKKIKYTYNINIVSKIKPIMIKLNKSNDLKNESIEKLNNSNILIKKLNNEFDSNSKEFEKINDYQINYEKLLNEKNNYEEEYKKLLNYKRLNNNINDLKVLLKNELEKYEIENNTYLEMQKKYYLNEAYILSQTLEDNKPCPVCGSINHPQIAKISSEGITKDELDNESNKVSKINDNKKKYEIQIEELNAQIDELNINKDTKIEEEIKKYDLLISSQSEKIDLFNKEYNNLKKLKDNLVNKITGLEKEINIYEETIIKCDNEIKNYSNDMDVILNENNTSMDEFNKNEVSNEELNDLNNLIIEYDTNKKEYNTKILMLSKEVKDKNKVDIDKQKDELNILNNKFSVIDNLYIENNTKLEKIKDILNNIKKYVKEFKLELDEINLLKMLSDTANGKLVGKQKITFENYVQSYYLNSVLIEANKRLFRMSDGRYELKRKEIASNLTEKMGLEFSVFDAYTGKLRDVSSLSGGEKFKASLSLALGLSDVISMFAGGIKMDCLFIDEGFGSLDQESLNQALNTISDLVDNDKLVGIISHVSELISRIDNKIYVKKHNTGSTILIES